MAGIYERTAADERADVVAFLYRVSAKYDERALDMHASSEAHKQLSLRAAVTMLCADRISKGAHIGAAKKEG